MSSHQAITWHKSSHSATTNGCVEVGWRKSSYSAAANGCVEVTTQPTEVGIRDTKDRTGGTLHIPAPGWTAFLHTLR